MTPEITNFEVEEDRTADTYSDPRHGEDDEPIFSSDLNAQEDHPFDSRRPDDTITSSAPLDVFQCDIPAVGDGDTADARIDLRFEMRMLDRVRIRDIDTREIHFVRHDSEEYQRGMLHKEYFEDWVTETKAQSDDEDFPFILYSQEFAVGKYGRIIGDFWSPVLEEWYSRSVFDAFEDVAGYP